MNLDAVRLSSGGRTILDGHRWGLATRAEMEAEWRSAGWPAGPTRIAEPRPLQTGCWS